MKLRQHLLASTLLVGSFVSASPAFAQDTTEDPQAQAPTGPVEAQPTPSVSAEGEEVQTGGDIIVTGSRIPQPNLTSAAPVTVVSDQDVKLSGSTRIEDVLNQLPSVGAAQASGVSNGATGTAEVDLRYLGAKRSLALVNGRRLMPGDPNSTNQSADLNVIPSALIRRAEVLTGGASSVYGADAVAGVVNFIMDTNFRGLRIDGQASVFQHDNRAGPNIINPNTEKGFRPPRGLSTNGGAQDVAVAFGTSFADNRGSILAYATYRTQDPVLEATRDFSFCSLGAAPNYVAAGSNFYCGGSSTNALGRFRFFHPTIGTKSGARVSRTLGPNAPNGSGVFVPGFALFNFAPFNFFQRPDERYTLGTFAEYEISPGAKPYLEAMFMHDRSDAVIAPGGDFGNTTTINCDNPLLSAQQLAQVCRTGNFLGENIVRDRTGVVTAITGTPTVFTDSATGATFNRAHLQINRRNVEGGGRDNSIEHTSYRIVAGMRGDLLRGLSYDAYYQYGTTRLTSISQNDFSVRKLNEALDVVTDPTTGLPVCRSVLNGTDTSCVPFNVFAQGGVTPATEAFLQTPGLQTGNVNETIADANFTFEGGEYGLQTPWSDRGIGVNVGAEYRKESLATQVDVTSQTGDLAGSGGPTLPVSGFFDVRELFTEVQVPIVSHSFFEDLTVTGGYRFSDYKVAGNHFSTDTYKIAAEFAPIRDIRLRASYNRAVRAPNVVELFSTQSLGLAAARTSVPVRRPMDWSTASPRRNAPIRVSPRHSSASSIQIRRTSSTRCSAAIPTCRRKRRTRTPQVWSSSRAGCLGWRSRSTISTSRSKT
ncbi:MAG TPA: TonB-dependent receptor [Sphingomicrobium sp.]|nr:TonB-dependent receptor [Sphingomicrobium sp.]